MFQKIVQSAVGDHYLESNYFSPAFARYHGGYSGFCKVPIYADAEEVLSGHGQSVVPCLRFDAGGLTGHQYVQVIGESKFSLNYPQMDLRFSFIKTTN